MRRSLIRKEIKEYSVLESKIKAYSVLVTKSKEIIRFK